MEKKKNLSQASNRKHVIEIAAQMFLTGGYAFTSMDDVMRVSKVSKSNIYYHFKSKDELLLAVVEYWIDVYEAALYATLSQNERGVEERILEFVDMLASGIEERDCHGGCPFLSLYVQSPANAQAVKARITGFFIELQPLLTKLFHQGIKKAEFRAVVQPEQAASLFIAALEGALVLAETMQNVSMIRETAQNFCRMLR